MGKLIPFDFVEHKRQKHEQQETYRILKAAMDCPPSKTITDFFSYHGCAYYNVLSVATLPEELKTALAERIKRLAEMVDEENKVFCSRYSVVAVSDLSDEQFSEYQKSLKELVDREDHYTNIPSCKTVTDFFRHYRILYYTPASIMRLPPILRYELESAIFRFSSAFDAAREALLLRYGVVNELALTVEEYAEYSRGIEEVILREDHYP